MVKKIGLLFLFLSFQLHAGSMGEVISSDYSWFAAIGTGFSWTEKPGIYNPDPTQWDPAIEGYNSRLGDRGFYSFAIGAKIIEFIDIEMSYLNHEVFDYQKFQTGEQSGQTAFTGNARTRFFQLDNRVLLVNGFLYPYHGLTSLKVNIKPFVSGGIGYSHNQVRKFYTVGSTIIANTSVGSTSSIGSAINTNSFAWQGSTGLTINPIQSHLGINIGYRYFNGGKFNTSSTLYTNSNGIINTKNWRGYLKANQFFLEILYWI